MTTQITTLPPAERAAVAPVATSAKSETLARLEEMAAARKKREGVVPEADALVSIIAEAYDVSNEAARGWLGLRFGLTHIGFDLAKDAAV